MPKVLVVGAMGRMGQSVRAAIEETTQLELGAALEAPGQPCIGGLIGNDIEISDDPKAALSGCDVAIDFTTPEATLRAMRAAAEAEVAYVCGTTGFSDAECAEVGDLAARIPIVHAPNFSVAVNILAWLTREATRKLGSDYDAELVEIHHSEKRDAPSGPRCISPRQSQLGAVRNSPTTWCWSARAISARGPRMRSASRPCAAETSRVNTP